EARVLTRAIWNESVFDWVQGTLAFWIFDRFASSLRHIFPVFALVIHRRCASAGSASAGLAIILSFQSDAIAFVHGWLRRNRTRRSGRSKKGGRGSGGGG